MKYIGYTLHCALGNRNAAVCRCLQPFSIISSLLSQYLQAVCPRFEGGKTVPSHFVEKQQ